MKKRRDYTVFLWNMTEDVWPFVQTISDKKLQQIELSENDLYADREIYSLPAIDADLYITPSKISNPFVQYVHGVIGKFPIELACPKTQSHLLCLDVFKDKKLLKHIINQVKVLGGSLVLRSYSASEQFLKLVVYFKKQGLEVLTPEAPQESAYWTTNFFGSKSGIRQTVAGLNLGMDGVDMPRGKIVMDIKEAVKIAYSFYKSGGVVIKTNKGHSGAGVLIFGPGSLPQEYKQFTKKLKTQLDSNLYWRRFPIVLEEYILPNKTVAGGNPNVEFYINPQGVIEHLYSCGMRVDKHGVFGGVEIGEIQLPQELEVKMLKVGKKLAAEYVSSGYYGYFDMDFILGVDQKLYLAESNVRRTGGTYVFNLARSLFGKTGFNGHYFASTVLTLNKSIFMSELIQKLGDCAYDSRKQEGIIIMSANLLTIGKLMYVVVAKTKNRALKIEAQMRACLL